MVKMKTVQEWLRELNTDRLIGTWKYAHRFDHVEHPDMFDMTIRQILEQVEKTLTVYINYLRGLPIKAPSDGHRGLLFVSRCIRDGSKDKAYNLCFLDELMAKGVECQHYAYEFTEQSEIMGFLVADTPLTLRHIYALMVNVLHTASFFGFKQEYLAEEKEILIKASQDNDANRAGAMLFDEFMEKMEKRLGFKPDRESEDERALRVKVMEAEQAYAMHSRKKELTLILASLREDHGYPT